MAMVSVEVTKSLPTGNVTTVELGEEGFGGEVVALPGPEVKLAIKNAAGERHLVLLERTAWADHVVTGDFVGTLPEFRTLFSEQVLAPGVRVKVARLAFLFTDLKASTAMYEEQGDAKAFALVRDHFKVMDDPIAAEGGAVVKTIGDAIMAVFPDAASCFRAGVAIQHGITEYNRNSGEIPLIVKAGAHVGACLAVTLNDTLDYFGTTVNVAARVQNESRGEDLVLTEAMVEDPGVARLLAEKPYEADVQDIRLKGLTGAFKLTRLWPLRLSQAVAAASAEARV
jgi:class 3 adenylate cyclase